MGGGGDINDISLDISHTVSQAGNQAFITISAQPSEAGKENGVTKVTKVEIRKDGRLKKGKRSDGKWEFTVKKNGVYSFVIYYDSKEGKDMTVASSSEIEKAEPNAEAEPQKPGGDAGGAGEASGNGTVLPEGAVGQEATTSKPEEGMNDGITKDNNTEEDKKNDGMPEGDSNQDTTKVTGQKPSDEEADGKEAGKGESADNQEGTGSAGQSDSSDSSTSGSLTGDSSTGASSTSGSLTGDSSTGASSTGASSTGDNSTGGSSTGDSSTGGSLTGDSSTSGSLTGDGSTSASSTGDGSTSDSSTGDSSTSGSSTSDSSMNGSSMSGSSTHDSSRSNNDSDSDSPGTSIALNVIDFFFPVIEAQAKDFTVKKEATFEYEITDLFLTGNPKDIDVNMSDETTEQGAMITLLARPSEAGEEKGVSGVTDISLIDFEPKDKPNDNGENSIATDSKAEETEKASRSDAAYVAARSSSAEHAEYQDPESGEGEYKFFVKENGIYKFAVRYDGEADLNSEDDSGSAEKQFIATYKLDSIGHIQFKGVEDVTIQAGDKLDLLSGVSAVSDDNTVLPVTVQDDGGFDAAVPNTYKIIYAAAAGNMSGDGSRGTAERSVTVLPRSGQVLQIESDVHGAGEGKTLEVSPNGSDGLLTVDYKLPDGVKGRVLKFAWPEGTTATYPTEGISNRYSETSDGTKYECLLIDDSKNGNLNFQIRYRIDYGKQAFASYTSNPDSYKKAEAYLKASGKVDIGGIHVVAGNSSGEQAVQPVEASIGPFITTPLEEGPIPVLAYKMHEWNAVEAPFKTPVNVDLGEAQPETSYPVFLSDVSSANKKDIVFEDNSFTTKYKPWCIKNIRVYAPDGFNFKLDQSYVDEGIITGGQDAAGSSYMDIKYGPDTEAKLRPIFWHTSLVLQKNAEISRKTCTSKNTVITYIDYGGDEKTTETNPVVTVELYPTNIEKVNRLRIKNRVRIIVGGESGLLYTYIGNEVGLETTVDGVKHVKMPNQKKDIKASIKYPDELWVDSWNIGGSSLDRDITYEYGQAQHLHELMIHLHGGGTVEYKVDRDIPTNPFDAGIDIKPGKLIPSNVHVDSVDFIFSDFYGSTAQIISYADTKAVDEGRTVDATVEMGGNGTDSAADTAKIELIPRPMLRPRADIISYFGYAGKANEDLTVYPRVDLGYGRQGTNCKIRIDDGNMLKFFDGSLRLSDSFQDVKITYTTDAGKKGEMEIQKPDPANFVQFVKLGPEEHLTMVEVYEKGTIVGGGLLYGCRKITYEELKAFASDGNTVQFNMKGSVTMDERKDPISITAQSKGHINYRIKLGAASANLSNVSEVYQGEKMEVKEIIKVPYDDWGYPEDHRSRFIGALGYAVYYKLGSPDKFAFMGLESDDFDAVLVKEKNEEYIKVTPKKTKEFQGEQNKEHGRIYLELPDLVFQAIPGAAPGNQVVISDIYFAVDKAQQKQLSEQYRVNLGCDSAMPSDQIPDWVQDKDLAMWNLNAQVKTTILQQNLSGVNILPGLNRIYKDKGIDFYPTDQEDLNAMVSIGNGSDVLNNYTARIPLPRKGKEIKYSFGGAVHTAVSQYGIYLRDGLRPVDSDIKPQVKYRLAGNDTFVSDEEVNGRWGNVEEIEIFIKTLPAKSSVTYYLDLAAEGKADIGTGEKRAYIAAQSQYEDGRIGNESCAEFDYKDFTISGKAWIDNNEDGKYESGEPNADQLNITLLQNNGAEADRNSYYISQDNANGNYSLHTYLHKDLSMRFDGLNGSADGLKPAQTKTDANGGTSVFQREGGWTAVLPKDLSKDKDLSGYDLGIVKLPVLTVNNTQVGYKKEVQAAAAVTNQPNAPEVNKKIIYSPAADTSIASVSDTGLIKGLKKSSVTTATASVKNSLGDEVTKAYQIAVGNDREPILDVHPWVAIEGDSIPDWWAGIKGERSEEEYPDWNTFRASRAARSAPTENKSVTVYTDRDYAHEISAASALNARGLYYVQYSASDDKGNTVKKDTTLTVYGKIQGEGIHKHYFETGETISVPKAEFYYLDVTGTKVAVTDGIKVEGPDQWVLKQGSLASIQRAAHPESAQVTDGVSAGNGRECELHVTADVDSKFYVEYQLLPVGEPWATCKPFGNYTAICDEAGKIGVRYGIKYAHLEGGEVHWIKIENGGIDLQAKIDGTAASTEGILYDLPMITSSRGFMNIRERCQL